MDLIVDLARWPLDRPASDDWRAAVAAARLALAADGAAAFPGFLTPGGLAQAADEARTIAPLAWKGLAATTAYYGKDRAGFDDGHPRTIMQTNDMGLVADYDIPADHVVKRLFHWQPFADFLAATLGEPRLHRFGCPAQAVNLSVMRDGGHQVWHFDSGRFTITLLLQAPESGGTFEYVPALRSEGEENYAAVGRVLAGDRTGVRSVALEAGTLLVFLGEHALHRVAPVQGAIERLIAIWLFDTMADRQTRGPEYNAAIYGPRALTMMPSGGARS